VDKILAHLYTEMLLNMWPAFWEDGHRITSGKSITSFQMLHWYTLMDKEYKNMSNALYAFGQAVVNTVMSWFVESFFNVLFSDHLYIVFKRRSSPTKGVAGKQRRLTALKKTAWIYRMDELFTNLFGPDCCQHEYTEKTKHCVMVPGQFPLMQYQHKEWE